MKNNKNLAWALVGLLILIVVGGYFYSADPLGWRGTSDVEKQESAEAKPEGTSTGKSEGSSSDATAGAMADESKTVTAGGDSDSGGEPAKEATAQLSVPTFDLVRVEPDGSTLIAGQAAPGTAVEVVANGKVIATVKAGTSGDFAAVVDDRLAPGDHEIVLRSTGEGNASTQSEEVATISVPESDPSELLVMVTKPGEASRILTKPEAADSKVAKQATEVAEVAAADEAEEKLAAEEKAEEAATTEIAAEKQSSDTDTKVAAAAESEPAKEMAEEKTETKVAVTDQASGTTSGETVKTEPEPAAEAKPEMAKEEPETVKSEPETVKSPEETAKSEAVVAAEPTLRIDAVEIENGRVFIAGSATPGGAVRVYADGQAVGSSDVSDSGRFLVEAQKDIAVGDHTISADLVMQADAAPVMRVAVPFTRPEGEMVAAVAAPATDSSATSDTAAVETGKKSEKPAAETSATNETAAEKTEVAAADTKSESTAASEQTSAKAEEKSSQMAAAETPEKKGTGAKEGSANEAAASASDTQTQVASADTQSDDTNTVVQPALEPRDGSVIIRRGDTLWQISRRVYGRGVRYTTIYLANEDQIKNPDMIEPGQIFMVPDEPLENAEELHRDRIRGR